MPGRRGRPVRGSLADIDVDVVCEQEVRFPYLVEGATIEFTIEHGRLIGDPVVPVRRADLWMTHPDIVAMMELSAADVEAGRTSGPLGVDEFLARLDDA